MFKGKTVGLSSDRANKIERDFRKILWHQCQCSGSSQIPSEFELNYHQFLSLYKIKQNNDRTELIIYDTEKGKKERKILGNNQIIDGFACITQLPSGELFCYGSFRSGIALIVDRNYRFRMLPSGIHCHSSSALYFDNNIYCFGGRGNKGKTLTLSRKFDLEKNLWINLASLPKADSDCHSVIFNGNILVSGFLSKNLWLYSIEIDSFSIIRYDFGPNIRKLMINVGKLYLFKWSLNGSIYEGEDEYHWRQISKAGDLNPSFNMYCLYNKEKIYISTWDRYYQFDLKNKALLVVK